MSQGRGKRVAIYTVTLLVAPLPVMPFERGTREFSVAILVCGVILSLGSLYTLVGECRSRTLLGMKLIAASTLTLMFGLGLVVTGAVLSTK